MTYEEFERRAREIFDAIPPEMRHGVDYLAVSEEAVPHPSIPDVYTLGECATGEYDLGFDAPEAVRSGVHLYHGSFVKLAELDPEFDWEGELWETITHEVMHHRESTAGEDDLEDMDYAEDENFKRREGQPFDLFFFRSGHAVAEGQWEVDGDRFVERTLDAAEFARAEEIPVFLEGEEVLVPRPEKQGDVHYVYLDGLYEDDGAGDVVLVLVRRRGTWEQLRGIFGRKPTEFLESAVDFAADPE
jgi:hypothetical protein